MWQRNDRGVGAVAHRGIQGGLGWTDRTQGSHSIRMPPNDGTPARLLYQVRCMAAL